MHMNISTAKLVGNILYFIGALTVAVLLIALLVTGGMVLIAGYPFIFALVAGAVLAGVGKRMIKNTQKFDNENKVS